MESDIAANLPRDPEAWKAERAPRDSDGLFLKIAGLLPAPRPRPAIPVKGAEPDPRFVFVIGPHGAYAPVSSRRSPMDNPTPTAKREETEAANPAPRRILLLEDDEAFKQIIALFLQEHGYEVVGVSNGVDGVRELAQGDFEVIICDMMMPSLPGDMFYLAVQRMRPHLCKRFVFITGYRGHEKINEFIKRINGTILMKPFQVNDLIEMIGFVQIRALLSVA
jgi:CheY-like chemotaxis protein